MQRLTLFCAGTLLFVALAGCKRGSLDTSGEPVANPRPAVTGNAMRDTSNTISVEPKEVACEPLTIPVVHWNAVPSPNRRRFEIWTGASADAPEAKLFASGGPAGSQETGRWAVPGTTFRLLEAGGGAEVARVTVGGPANCPPRKKRRRLTGG